MKRDMMDRNKTDWDYFAELMTEVPGLTAIFSDAVGSNRDGGETHRRFEREMSLKEDA